MRKLLYILQLEEYNLDRFQQWLEQNPDWKEIDPEKKQQLHWTLKALLIYSVARIIHLISISSSKKSSLIFAATLLKPLETAAKRAVILFAKLKINRQKKLQVIGITGSYGKTSTKLILKKLLSTKYNVLATPHSYNTELGVAKVILKQLKSCHQILIVEMGAYKRGEIRQICKMVKPKIGIITGITEQHLERFGTLQNIIKAKFELIESLPNNGISILNVDNVHIAKRAEHLEQQTITYATNPNRNASITATDVTILTKPKPHTEFKINIEESLAEHLNTQEETKENTQLKSPLVGRGQVQNTLAAIAASLHLEIPLDVQKQTINKLSHIPHRMQLIDPGTGILILDNAYSSNPAGFKEALNVLSKFKSRRKIIVTPGIIELGEKEADLHYEIGKQAGQTCDIIIFVGETTRSWSLAEGVKETKFDLKKLHFVKSLKAAQEKIAEISKPGDIILFENDLPDQYA